MRLTPLALLASATVILLTGCSSPQPPTDAELHSAIGRTLDQVESSFPKSVSPVYDLSSSIVNKPAAYSAGAPGGQWVVVVACAADSPNPIENMAVGVIPRNDYRASIRTAARDGRYDDLLEECAK